MALLGLGASWGHYVAVQRQNMCKGGQDPGETLFCCLLLWCCDVLWCRVALCWLSAELWCFVLALSCAIALCCLRCADPVVCYDVVVLVLGHATCKHCIGGPEVGKVS